MDVYWLTLPATVLGGAFGWSFTEYGMHNWRGHKGKGKNEFSREHLAHHAKASYFTPFWKKMKTAAVATAFVLPATWLVMGMLHAVVFTASFISMYGVYEWLHRRLHTHAPRGFYGRWARKHHFYHHFSRPTHNHGVTSPVWDLAFGTLETVDVVRVPAKQAMSWLVDPSTGEVREELRDDYEIVKRGSRRRSKRPPSTGAGLVEATT
jgi:sterol desaturase/sphingolipid hydroxylase (fatty acid hydroxylase superfamily)